jgi:hypothetical protein
MGVEHIHVHLPSDIIEILWMVCIPMDVGMGYGSPTIKHALENLEVGYRLGQSSGITHKGYEL